jgi:hypothetical protein
MPHGQYWSLSLFIAQGCVEYTACANGATCHGTVSCARLTWEEIIKIIDVVMRCPFITYPHGQRGVSAREFVAGWIAECCSALNNP